MDDSVKKRKSIWWHVVRILSIVGSICIIGVVGIIIFNLVTRSKLRAEIHKIRAAGEPTSYKELKDVLPEVVEKDNAAPLYSAGLVLMRHMESEKFIEVTRACDGSCEEHPGKKSESEVMKAFGELLEDNQEAISFFERGADLPECSFYGTLFDFDGGFSLGVSRHSRNLSVSQFLSLHTRYFIFHGQPKEALSSVVTSLRLTRIYDRCYLMIDQLIRLTHIDLALDELLKVIESCKPSNEELKRLDNVLAAVIPPDLAEKIMIAERVFIIENTFALEPSGNLELPWNFPNIWSSPRSLGVTHRSYIVPELRDINKVLEATRHPWPEILDKVDEVEYSGLWSEVENSGFYSEMDLKIHSRAVSQIGKCMARLRTIRTALAIERYRNNNNRKPPETLADLVPTYIDSVLVDPFTGEELLYNHDDLTYTVYSVGENRVDDGGDIKCSEGGTEIDLGERLRLITDSEPK